MPALEYHVWFKLLLNITDCSVWFSQHFSKSGCFLFKTKVKPNATWKSFKTESINLSLIFDLLKAHLFSFFSHCYSFEFYYLNKSRNINFDAICLPSILFWNALTDLVESDWNIMQDICVYFLLFFLRHL